MKVAPTHEPAVFCFFATPEAWGVTWLHYSEEPADCPRLSLDTEGTAHALAYPPGCGVTRAEAYLDALDDLAGSGLIVRACTGCLPT